MPRGASKFAAAGFGTCLILLCVVYALCVLNFRSPAPLSDDADTDAFSAMRAHDRLVTLLGDETPHPIGSPANILVKGRLVEQLTQLGLTAEVQDTVACSFKWPVCGRVQNVLARIDGEQKAGILLMAHYDSVQFASGAGDDGAGVAALLEVARVMRDAPKPRNSILFAFTDGEEAGLLGAEAFFTQHAWANDATVVINVEGSGSEGPSLLLRSGPRSGAMLDAFRSVAPFPVALSFSEELFKHLPHDTDLSVSNHAGKPGIDFAFVGERNHYHTRLDSIANLSLATLQHHGENVLPLVRALADADLTHTKPNYVYATLTHSAWLAYRPQTGLAISICVVVLLGLATWRRWQGPGHFFAALGFVGSTLVTIVVLELATLALADLLAGTRVAWPANPWPWRLIIYSIPIVSLALQRPLVRRVGFWNSWLAAWWFWSLLTLALSTYLPLASHLMLPPTVIATFVIVVMAFSHRLDRPVFRCAAAIITALFAGALMFPLAYMAETIQGLATAPAIFIPLALVAVTLLPLLDRGRVRFARRAAVLIAIAAVAMAHWATLYSDHRPQRVNFTYVVDADENRATYLAWSPNPLPVTVTEAMPFAEGATPLPWEWREPPLVASGDVIQREATTPDTRSVTGNTRTLVLRPAADTSTMALVIPRQVSIDAIRVNGLPVVVEEHPQTDYRTVVFHAPPATGVSVEIDAADAQPIDGYVVDIVYRLPDDARALIDARGTLATPGGHTGDRWIVLRRVKV
jgi:Peptidase family M28